MFVKSTKNINSQLKTDFECKLNDNFTYAKGITEAPHLLKNLKNVSLCSRTLMQP